MLKAVIYICCDTKFEDHNPTIACHFDNFCKSLGRFLMKFPVVAVTIIQTLARYYQLDPGLGHTINVLVFYVQKPLSSLDQS